MNLICARGSLLFLALSLICITSFMAEGCTNKDNSILSSNSDGSSHHDLDIASVDDASVPSPALTGSNEDVMMHLMTDSLKYCVTPEAIGVGGYDVISYFDKGVAEKGVSDHQHAYEDVTYFFVSEEHKNKFVQDAERFLPAFGGWCSMTLAMGRATTPTYDNFKIIDEKLYLFERTLSINGRALWVQDPENNMKAASGNYIDYLDDGHINPN